MNVPSERPPIRIGDRYRLEERIGVGAMGAVWRATDDLLHRTVAVKELLTAPLAVAGGEALEESRQRILREGRIGARLQHPHVIGMFDVVVHDDRPWLVMEYLPSRSLARVLAENGPMRPREAAEVGRQVADGLAALHLAGVVHRDVKPGNVLIAEDGRVKITDFGVSHAVDDVQLTRTGLITGTPAFLAPEVARGRDPTAASDVFALGATLYAAVEGRPPFGLGDNTFALLHRVATGVVVPPQRAGPLNGLVMWLLRGDPADRPSAAQARDALVAVAEGKRFAPLGTGVPGAGVPGAGVPGSGVPGSGVPVDPGPPTLSRSLRPRYPRRRRAPVLAAVVAALVAGSGITAVAMAGGSGGERGTTQAAPPPTAVSPPAPSEQPAFTSGPTPQPTRRPTLLPTRRPAPRPTPQPTVEPPPTSSLEPTPTPVPPISEPTAPPQEPTPTPSATPEPSSTPEPPTDAVPSAQS